MAANLFGDDEDTAPVAAREPPPERVVRELVEKYDYNRSDVEGWEAKKAFAVLNRLKTRPVRPKPKPARDDDGPPPEEKPPPDGGSDPERLAAARDVAAELKSLRDDPGASWESICNGLTLCLYTLTRKEFDLVCRVVLVMLRRDRPSQADPNRTFAADIPD